MRNSIKLLLVSSILFIMHITMLAQEDEPGAYKATSIINDKEKRIAALNEFIQRYPSGKLISRAYSDLFRLYVSKGNESEALKYAEMYLNTYPEASRLNPYNSVAYTLAENKLGLTAAAAYAQKAVSLAQNGSIVKLRQILDTQALVLFELGNADSALVLEREAIKGNEEDPSYLFYLAVYEEATGLRKTAMYHIAKAIMYGDMEKAPGKFDEWLKKEKPTAEKQTILKTNIVREVVSEYLKNSDKEELPLNNSLAASFMAKMNVDVHKAKEMAINAVTLLGKRASLEQQISLKINLSTVYAVLNEHDKALQELLSVKTYVSAYEGEYWYMLGQLYEKTGNVVLALDSYVQGLIAYENPKIKTAADSLANKYFSGIDYLTAKIDSEKTKVRNFRPEHQTRNNSSGRVVLAELFTGAECNPCVAADRAFDMLAENYPRTDVAILEYHVHIPGPDPLTNPDSYQRYLYYGGDFGTPTVFFDGGERLVGGGNDVVVPNRFHVYDYLINEHIIKRPVVRIKGSASINPKDIITINVELNSSQRSRKRKYSLHIALAEKTVNYTGANGISKHLFVVRDLVYRSEGKTISLNKKSISIIEQVNLLEIKKGISDYLDNPTTDVSWRGGVFGGWRERPDEIDKANLAVVVWIQENNSKEVLQSLYMDVKKK